MQKLTGVVAVVAVGALAVYFAPSLMSGASGMTGGEANAVFGLAVC